MKLALYQPWIYLHGGLEKSILELVKRSCHEWTIFTSHYDSENTFQEFKEFDVREIGKISVNRDITSVLYGALKLMTMKIDLKGYDALIVWCDGMGDMVTFRNNNIPVFSICSTPLRPVFDPVYIRQALLNRSFFGRIAFRFFQLVFRVVDIMAWKRYQGVIATSSEVKKRIIDGGLYQESSYLKLFYPGIDWTEYGGEKSYDPFLLVSGRIMWTKNIELAIKAFIKAELPEPWSLVIAGFLDEKSRSYLMMLKEIAGNSKQITFVISPSDKQLYELYKSASAILFPPLNEDWGIVPLEAMASSKPVLANNSGGPLESIISEKTGWLVSPLIDRWADIIKTIPDNLSRIKSMGENGRKHSRQYDWSEFVRGVDSTIKTWVKERIL